MYKMLPFFAIVTFGVWMGEFIPQKLPPKLLPLKDFGDPVYSHGRVHDFFNLHRIFSLNPALDDVQFLALAD